jgi:outer membrane receptor protein involved in Fe transport
MELSGETTYSLEGFYRSERGWRANNDLEQRQLSFFLKQQLTPKDNIFVQAIDTKLSGGDLFQYYDQSSAAPDFRFRETQDPTLLLGYHREWSPGVHTLLLATRLTDKFSFTNTAQPTLLGLAPVGPLAAAFGISMHEDFTAKPEIYTAELQQIWEQDTHNTIAGARFQYGHFETMNLQNVPDSFDVFHDPAALQDFSPLFKRLSLYGYHYWQVATPLQLIAGLTYDNMTFPENVLTAPISENVQTAERLSPKAGLIFTPITNTTVRFAYTRSLSGSSLDQSVQLEPSQLAGFLQSFRSIIPESVAGPTPGAHFETFGLALEQNFSTGTYIGASGEILNSDGDRTQGGFVSTLVNHMPSTSTSGFRENLNFKERSLIVTLNQLIGDQCSVGARYKLTKAELTDEFVDIPSTIPTAGFQRRQDLDSVLQQLSLNANYYHPVGIFAQFQALWSAQTNEGYTPHEPGDDFWQLNLFAGYRFPRRKAELRLGLLNLTDRDYKLNPLTLYQELPRGRTLTIRLQLNF